MSKLKEKLIRKIERSKNEGLLKEIYQILNDEERDDIIQLTDLQIQSIKQAEKEFEAGDFLTEEELDKEFDKWIEK